MADTRIKDAPAAVITGNDYTGYKLAIDKEGEESFESIDVSEVTDRIDDLEVEGGLINDRINVLEYDSGILNFINFNSEVITITHQQTRQVGQVATISLWINVDNDIALGDSICELPTGIGVPSADYYSYGSKSDGTDIIPVYLDISERTVKFASNVNSGVWHIDFTYLI